MPIIVTTGFFYLLYFFFKFSPDHVDFNTNVMKTLTGVGVGHSVFCVVFSCTREIVDSFAGHILPFAYMLATLASTDVGPPQTNQIRTSQGETQYF